MGYCSSAGWLGRRIQTCWKPGCAGCHERESTNTEFEGRELDRGALYRGKVNYSLQYLL